MSPRRGPQLPYRLVAGVTPAAGQWLVASAKVAGATFSPEEPRLRETFLDVLNETPQMDCILLNAPVGHPNAELRGYRRCDLEAREILGPRGNTILPVASRSVMEATDRFVEGLDAITSAMLPRYRQVTEEMSPFRQRTIYEGRPELSFMILNSGSPMHYAKSTEAGVEEREWLLRDRVNGIERILDNPGVRVKRSQLLDVCVLMWSARRAFTRAARRFPADGEWDREGVRMEFVA